MLYKKKKSNKIDLLAAAAILQRTCAYMILRGVGMATLTPQKERRLWLREMLL